MITKTTTERSLARKVLQTEAAAILALVDRLDERFDRAVHMLRDCRGRVIVTGMGKSGIICRRRSPSVMIPRSFSPWSTTHVMPSALLDIS